MEIMPLLEAIEPAVLKTWGAVLYGLSQLPYMMQFTPAYVGKEGLERLMDRKEFAEHFNEVMKWLPLGVTDWKVQLSTALKNYQENGPKNRPTRTQAKYLCDSHFCGHNIHLSVRCACCEEIFESHK